MTIKNVTNHLEAFAPLSLQESYDNSGLLVGDASSKINGILICLDSTEAIIDEAISANCNLIIAHHPIVFSGLKKLNGKNYIEKVIIKAIRNNIAIYAIHTNLDNVHNGVNAKIAEKLGLINCRVLAPKNNLLKKLVTFAPKERADTIREALFNAGAGNIGNYSHCSYSIEGTGTFLAKENTNPYIGKIGELHIEKEERIEVVFSSFQQNQIITALLQSHPYEEVAYDIYTIDNSHPLIGSGIIGELPAEKSEKEVLSDIKSSLQTDCIRHTNLIGNQVKYIAICGGSGSFLLPNAIQQGAQILVTADFKYHQFFDADDKIIIADVGHYESEQFTKELIHEILIKKFTTFAIHLSKINTNPINYL
jgi:dinuclear metal center YbgI/SA1388 family protein